MSTFALITRALSCVALATMIGGGPIALVTFLVGELTLYFTGKLFMRDLQYWVPVYGLGGAIVTYLLRAIIYVSVCWTAIVHFRVPTEVGGAFWSFAIFVTIILGITTALMHDDVELTIILLCSVAGFVLSFALFLSLINREYVWTFFDLTTSSSFIIEHWQGDDRDKAKLEIFHWGEQKWRKEIGDDVKEWCSETLPELVKTKPEWFTDYAKSTIPDWAVEDNKLLTKLRNRRVLELRSERLLLSPVGMNRSIRDKIMSPMAVNRSVLS